MSEWLARAISKCSSSQPNGKTQTSRFARAWRDGATWRAVLDRFFAGYDGLASIQINDAGATPGVVSLRLAQAVEASEQ